MKENIEEDIKVMANIITHYIEADKCGLSNNDFKREIKALSNILTDYKRVLKENEELKRLLNGNLYEDYKYYKNLAGEYQGNCISKQKIKEKIERYKNILDFSRTDKSSYTKAKTEVLENIIKDLQDLLEEKGE